jgi:hypothetical protein
MTQRLSVEVKDPATGAKSTKEVVVIRSWQSVGGAELYLHANGVYGYKNGAPVRGEEEFTIINNPIQNRAAMAWWQRFGKQMAADYYAAEEARLTRLAGDFVHSEDGDDSSRDAALYFRRAVKLEEGASPSNDGPFSWMDLFPRRPDWWGQAQEIQFNDWIYTMIAADAPAKPVKAAEAPSSGTVKKK